VQRPLHLVRDAMTCDAPHCDQGMLPDLFVRHDHPCPAYAQEALVNPFDRPQTLPPEPKSDDWLRQ
jgi:hypothetical protein